MAAILMQYCSNSAFLLICCLLDILKPNYPYDFLDPIKPLLVDKQGMLIFLKSRKEGRCCCKCEVNIGIQKCFSFVKILKLYAWILLLY